MRRIVLLTAVLFLGGCAGLAGLGGALVSTVGGGALDAVQSKIEARAEWRAEDKRIRGLMVQSMVTYAMVRLAAGEFDEAMRIFQRTLVVHKEGQPLFLIQELRKEK